MLNGLETIQLNLTDQKRIDSFQLKGYRRILHYPPTSIDRTITNDFVKSEIRNHMKTELKMFSSIWQKRKLSLVGHIIRSAPSHPMRQVLFEKGTLIPRLEFRKRPGKPRQQWLTTTYDDAYQTLNQLHRFDMDNPAHRQLVNDLACQGLESSRNPSPKIVTENSSPKANGFLLALPYHIGYWDYFCFPLKSSGFFKYLFVSYTKDLTLHCKVESSFTPGTVFLHDYAGFCA